MDKKLTNKEFEENKKFSLRMEAKEFTDYLYNAYGSGYGVLFGIPSNCRDAVYTIVQLVIERKKATLNYDGGTNFTKSSEDDFPLQESLISVKRSSPPL